jgi:Ca2+:H+ antiporter
MKSQRGISGLLKNEWPLLLSSITTLLFLMLGKDWLADFSNPFWFVFILAWLFGTIMLSAFAVVRHAEAIAFRLGEPLGTPVLTLSMSGMEMMMIAAVMYSTEGA